MSRVFERGAREPRFENLHAGAAFSDASRVSRVLEVSRVFDRGRRVAGMIQFAFCVAGRTVLWETRGKNVHQAETRMLRRVFDEYGRMPDAYICRVKVPYIDDDYFFMKRVEGNARHGFM